MIVFQRIELTTLPPPRSHFKLKIFGYKAFSSFFHFNFLNKAASNSFIPNGAEHSVWIIITAIVRVGSWTWLENNLMDIHAQNGHNKGIAIDHLLLRFLLHRTAQKLPLFIIFIHSFRFSVCSLYCIANLTYHIHRVSIVTYPKIITVLH